jgi:hypothetical protein
MDVIAGGLAVLFGAVFINSILSFVLLVVVAENTRKLVESCTKLERFLDDRFTERIDKL